MPLTLTLKTELNLPIEVDGINPERFEGLSLSDIARCQIWCGRTQRPLDDFFAVTGNLSEDQTIVWQGDLSRVHRIGQQISQGTIRVAGSVGHHTGFQMSGGRIEIDGDAADYLGAEMTGGTIVLTGDAADHVGSCFSGEKFGMNRGQIFIQGSAGSGLGQGMRRGTIVVNKSVGKLAGWNMLAGTIVCFGDCGSHPGAGMKRGTIVVAAQNAVAEMKSRQLLLPTFSAGSNFSVPVLKYLKSWLTKETIGENPVFESSALSLLDSTFQTFHGDQLRGGRGELFLAST
jgi:formylmethanofuran dehydrogenase subunit C